MSNKLTNTIISGVSTTIGEMNGTSPCNTCTSGDCCRFQHEIGIASSEFDDIEHLVTDAQIERAREALLAGDNLNGLPAYRCPFLSEAGKCEIYDERFMICAMYSVVGTNAQCSREHGNNVVQVVNPIGVISMAASSSKDVEARMKRHILLDTEGSDVLKEFNKRYLKDNK